MSAVISDTSCFIILSNIDELGLLNKIYGTIITTSEIADEYGYPLPPWVEIKEAVNVHYQQILELQVDKGEASAIALAIELNCLIILDDSKARKVAKNLGLSLTGTIGVIIKAKLNGIIPSVRPYLEKIRKTNFRLSDHVFIQALREAGEL